MTKSTQKKAIIIVSLLFALFIIIGLIAFDDYGVCVDDPYQRQHGIVTYRWLNRKFFDRGVFVNEGTEDLDHYISKYYGVAIQLPLILMEDIYQFVKHEPMQIRTIYHVRHLFIHFVFLLSLLCFYLTIKDLFHSSSAGIVSVLMVYSFGRYFSHSFFNIKDSVFASLFTISLFCAVRAIKTGYSYKWCLLFAISSAFAVSSRIVGALLPVIFLVMILAEHLIKHKRPPFISILLICMAYPIWLLITPASWSNPLVFSLECATKFSDYDGLNDVRVLIGGKVVRKENIPADFFLRWIGITVPLAYLLFSIVGLITFLHYGTGKKRDGMDPVLFKSMIMIFLIFFVTIMYQIIKKPTVYSDWRHIYFIYPLIITYAVFGLRTLFTSKHWGKYLSAGLLSVSLIYNFAMMIKNHPSEFMAYNPVGQSVANLYQGDYWGMSKLHLLHWILDHNSEKKSVSSYPAVENERYRLSLDHQMLDDDEQGRLTLVEEDADYLIVWSQSLSFAFGLQPPVIEGYENVYSETAYGAEISAVYQKTAE